MSQIQPPLNAFRPHTPAAFSGASDIDRNITIPAGSTVNVCKQGIWLFPTPQMQVITLNIITNVWPYFIKIDGGGVNIEQEIAQTNFSIAVPQNVTLNYTAYAVSANIFFHKIEGSINIANSSETLILEFQEIDINDAILTSNDFGDILFVLGNEVANIDLIPLYENYLALEKIPTNSDFTDVDDNPYNTVIIGTQEWTARNADNHLGVYYNIVNNGQAGTSEPFFQAGRLFTAINAANAISAESLGAGWRVPTYADFQKLFNYIMSQHAGTDMSNIARYLKASFMWQTNSGLDVYGFRGLPAGFGNYNAQSNFYSFLNLYQYGNYWCVQAPNSTTYATATMHDQGNYINFLQRDPNDLFSVRYVRDIT